MSRRSSHSISTDQLRSSFHPKSVPSAQMREGRKKMVTEEPRVKEASRYSLEEASKLLGMHRNTLLKYANKGIIKTGIRRSNSRRFYLGREILRFWKAQL